ncbi:hypothetical protein R5O87_17645 [Arthrobacter globiformis]|uniref:hypothetical protein n=1 Tax=Arthrobacter globiformis TaxID=1665 RepID=UPI00397BB14E
MCLPSSLNNDKCIFWSSSISKKAENIEKVKEMTTFSGVSDDANTPAVEGQHNAKGTAVLGHTVSGTGVVGTSTSGVGVWGKSESSSGLGGVSTSGIGVHGVSEAGPAVRGDSESGVGVFGASKVLTGTGGVSVSGIGVHGDSQSGAGVRASSKSGPGIWADSATNEGVHSETASTHHAAIVAFHRNETSDGAAIYAEKRGTRGHAGYFAGNVAVSGSIIVQGADLLHRIQSLELLVNNLVQKAVPSGHGGGVASNGRPFLSVEADSSNFGSSISVTVGGSGFRPGEVVTLRDRQKIGGQWGSWATLTAVDPDGLGRISAGLQLIAQRGSSWEFQGVGSQSGESMTAGLTV